MNPEQWRRAKEILAACLELDSERRHSFLDQACGDDLEMRRELDSLILAYDEEEDPLERPPLAPEQSEGASMIGRRVGHYSIVRELGEGGMARVYLGLHSGDAFRKRAA